jgi:DNA-binding MarR family transcriptional regulator
MNKIEQINKTPRDYGTGHMLYQSEIHTIEVIGKNENTNAGQIASLLGVTNGAVTQIADKLIKKGLIYKYYLPNNKKEVYYKLTELGRIADTSHSEFRDFIYSKVSSFLDELQEDSFNILIQFFDEMIKNWPS